MHQLNCGCRRNRLAPVAADGLAGQQQQRRPEALARVVRGPAALVLPAHVVPHHARKMRPLPNTIEERFQECVNIPPVAGKRSWDRHLLAYEMHDDLAVASVIQFDEEDALPLAEYELAVVDGHRLAGAQEQLLAV